MGRVLLVEDQPEIADILRMALADAGFELEHATTLQQARVALATPFDAVLLDLGLPDGNGIELCRELRRSSTVPILIITARRSEVDRVLGLELGADDYIVKPFSPREVAARLGAVLRRQSWSTAPARATAAITASGLTLDESRCEARVDDEPISLTRTEFRLLLTLGRQPGRVYSREQLIVEVWNGAYIQDRVVDSVISRVRRKLGDRSDGSPYIRTVHGVGYSLAD